MMFDKNFTWGTATAAYQIEGGYDVDGKGLSIWDVGCERSDRIKDESNGNIACDHYRRYKEDVDLIAELGGAYRFSLSWTRILPNGIGKVNTSGIKFYRNLLTELKNKGIEPYVTLFHWDYPYELFCQGGWLNDKSSDWFSYYTSVVMDNLGDLLKNVITINEPQCIIGCGHYSGYHAPFMKYSLRESLRCLHNLLLAHGKASRIIKRYGCNVSIAPCSNVVYPSDNSEESLYKAREAYFSIDDIYPFSSVTMYSDPIIKGDYPEEYYKKFRNILPEITKEDLDIIASPIDFYCQNIYSGEDIEKKDLKYATQTGNGWNIMPKSLYYGPKFLYERYKLPIYITENGVSYNDLITDDGKVEDTYRIEFLKKYLKQLKMAIKDGVDVRGYFLWSLIDNFEWAEGYTKRFGIVYVDYKTQKRIPKASYYWYKNIIKNNGKDL